MIINYYKYIDMVTERTLKTMDVPQDVMGFYQLFKDNGKKLYLVGGCVRDFLMNIKPHDFDMVTDAQPNEVIEILKDYRTDIHGVHFGVVRVYTESEPLGYEIASYRIDTSKGRDTKGTNQKVEIGSHVTIKDDVLRRDITINALFYNIGTGEIIDIIGGKRDIKNKIIRSVGDPLRRIEEDRLRIIRIIRFAAVTNSKIDHKTHYALKKDSRLFGISREDDVSRERIFSEFLKVKEKTNKNNDPRIMTRFINLLIDYNIMKQIFPVLVTEKDIVPTTYLTVALAQTLKNNKIDDTFYQTLVNAKIPIDYVKIIGMLVTLLHNSLDPENAYEMYKELKSKGVRNDILREWIRVMGIQDKTIKTLLIYQPTTSGSSVMKDGFKGAQIGEEIRRIETIKFKELLNNLN